MIKRFWMGLVTVLMAIAITITISYAWFINGYDVDPLATGESTEAYYYGGTGTEEDPYIITTPRHLYNLAWLQYLGIYNDPKKLNGSTEFKPTYFKLGVADKAGTLDMSGWPLPPIGTTKYPFIGNFNGNGWTIENLTTTNTWDEFGSKHPSMVSNESGNGVYKFEKENCSVIGFFGAIGAYDDSVISDSYSTGYTCDTTNNKVYNFYLKDNKVHTSYSSTLIGAVAGYVNATIEDVGVIKPNLNIQAQGVTSTSLSSKTSSNISDFAVVGYAEEEFTTQKTKSSTIIYNPTYDYAHFNFNGMGDKNDWGGSIDMSSLYTRINSRLNNSTLSSYVTQEIIYNYDHDDINVKSSPSSTHYYKEYSNGSGAYLTQNKPGYNGYDYLTGLYKNVVSVTKTDDVENGYTISNGTNVYLDITSERTSTNSLDFTVSLDTDGTNNKRVWVYKNKSLYTYNEDDGYKYYLNYTNDGLAVSKTSSTEWNYDETHGFYITSGSDYYLSYVNNKFDLFYNVYLISDSNGNYVKRVNGTITNTKNINEATRWYISDNEGTLLNYLYDISDTNYRLGINNNSLIAGNVNTVWSTNGNNLYSNDKYLKFDGNNWTIETRNTFYIQYDNHYLSLSDGNLSDQNKVNATIWSFTDSLNTVGGSGKIFYNDNGTIRYLKYNNGLDTTTDSNDSNITWNRDERGIYYNDNGSFKYLMYKNGWGAIEPSINAIDAYYISYNGTYLNADGTSAVTGSATAETIWYVDSNYNVFTGINGTNYYLYTDTTWKIKINTNTNNQYQYKKYNNTIRYLYSGNQYYYISLNDNGWIESSSALDLAWTQAYAYDYGNSPIASLGTNFAYLSKVSETSGSIATSANTNIIERSSAVEKASLFNYIPLNTNSDYSVKESNTGYIMSGGHSGNSGSLTGVDIRVAGEAQSYNTSGRLYSSYSNHKITNVYTYDGSLHKIDESKYEKYQASKTSMESTLKQHESAIGGVHFITSEISTERLVTASSVMINGKSYTDYQMPENSIDFNLAKKGYINFFATLYYPGSTTFFSLHKITRDKDQNITAINHIVSIYKSNSDKTADYVYEYENIDPNTGYKFSNNSNTAPSGYTKVFSTSWIETPTFSKSDYDNTTNDSRYANNGWWMAKLFYFEIPVNEGEYALGSVNGRDGGYLLYLDIGANAAPVDRTIITEQTKTTQESLSYVNGIQILAEGSSYTNDANSCVAAISSLQGEVNIERVNNTISFKNDNSVLLNLNSSYKAEGITLSGASLVALDSKETYKNILKYIDYNRATDKLYYTTIYNDGNNNTSYDCYRVENGVKTQITDTSNQAEWGILTIVDGAGSPTSLANFENIKNKTYGKTEVLSYYTYIDTANLSTLIETIDMNIQEDSKVKAPSTSDYTYEHSYSVVGYSIEITPNGLIVYFNSNVTISGPTSNVVTITSNSNSYTFSFNAKEADNSNKKITI